MEDTFGSGALYKMGAMSLTYPDKQWSCLTVSCAVLMNLTFSGSNESNNGIILRNSIGLESILDEL